MAGDTKSLAEVIREAIDGRLCELHTAMPGVIEKVDQKLALCDVKPLLQRKYKDKETAVDLPVITNVPLMFPRTKLAYLKLPVAKGDTVLLIFSERAIDSWKLKGGTVDPKFSRKHALSDAIAIPGLFPLTIPIATTSANDDLELGNGLAKIKMKKDGKMSVGNGVVELLTLFDDLVKALQGALTATLGGPQPLDPATQLKFTSILTKLSVIKE